MSDAVLTSLWISALNFMRYLASAVIANHRGTGPGDPVGNFCKFELRQTSSTDGKPSKTMAGRLAFWFVPLVLLLQ